MLSSFRVKNYRSILDLRMDFSFAEGKAPNGYKTAETLPFIETSSNHRLVACTAIFGANASGKTNILKALGALIRLIREGSPLSEVFEPNLLNAKFTDTTLETELIIGRDYFNYHLTFTGESILKEVLLKNGNPFYSIDLLRPEFSTLMLSSSYDKNKLADILRVECSDGEGRQIKPFLNRIGHAYAGLNADLKHVFFNLQFGILNLPNKENVLLPVTVDILSSTTNSDRIAALNEITDIIRRLDIDISSLEIIETQMNPDELPQSGTIVRKNQPDGPRQKVQVLATHRNVTGESVYFDFIKHESAGTQRLAGLVGLMLFALKTGGVLLIDELESSLHPLLMREIVLLFKKRRHNPHGAQLIFTTHNTDILDDSILRLSEIALVRKTIPNGTLVRRLVDKRNEGDDIRNVTNFRKQYLAGFYSGVPHPAL